MKYLAFIWSEGLAAPDELAVMRREIPGYVAAMERRPVAGELRLGAEASAFGRGEDGGACPYLMAVWTNGDRAATDTGEAWRRDLRARGLHVLGSALAGAGEAATVRVRGGETLVSHSPGTGTETFIAGVDVVRCADREQAVKLAAGHPAARDHTIEVRPFYTG